MKYPYKEFFVLVVICQVWHRAFTALTQGYRAGVSRGEDMRTEIVPYATLIRNFSAAKLEKRLPGAMEHVMKLQSFVESLHEVILSDLQPFPDPPLWS